MTAELTIPGALALDASAEQAARATLVEHFRPAYMDGTDAYVDSLLSIENYVSRFVYLQSVLGAEFFSRAPRTFISGCAVASEMIAARQFGSGPVHGIEVERYYEEISRLRTRCLPDMEVATYDGDSLPYEAGQFDLVASGHVIEHTRNPVLYLRESMRVLKPKGFLFLEFPTRFHTVELHTGLPSLEWLPGPVRMVGLRLLSRPLLPLSEKTRRGYRVLSVSGLKQISLGSVKRGLRRAGCPARLLNCTKAAPGILRCVFQKSA